MKNLKIMLLAVSAVFFGTSIAQQYAGDWTGNLKTQGISLPIVFHIVKAGESYSATMDSPSQKAFRLKVKSVTATPENILLDMSDMGIKYTASMKADSLEGNFAQAGQNFALNLGRMKMPVAIPKRPQEPKPKFNYKIEDVTFVNEIGLKFAGTLTTPKGKGPFPAVILVSGSGPQNRDEEILGHKPFWIIADYLANNGIAALRYDDRGVAGSEGNFTTATSQDFALDAQAAVEFLRKQQNVDKKKIGVIGHSEGGMIAPMLAAKDLGIGFIILLAGPGIPIDELMLKQTELSARAAGETEEEIAKSNLLNKACYEILKSKADFETSKKQLSELFKTEVPDSSDLNGLIQQINSPWFKYFISYDPQPVLEKVKCPVLAINGDKDQQVTSAENLAGIKQSLEKGGNRYFETYEAKNMNHLFQTTQTGLFSEYGDLEETFSPEILKLMNDWIHTLK